MMGKPTIQLADRDAIGLGLTDLRRLADRASQAPDIDALRQALNAIRHRAVNLYQLANEAEERARRDALEGAQ